jgi:glutaredoxin
MRYWLALILLTVSVASAAQTMYRWVDKNGGVHYTDHPPAPNKAAQVEEKHVVTLGVPTAQMPATLRQAVTNYPVTLYTQPDCGTFCQRGRDLLKQRGVPFTEKSVKTNQDVTALRTLVGGSDKLSVPVMRVGSQVVEGFYAGRWNDLLDAAGYPKAKAPSKP